MKLVPENTGSLKTIIAYIDNKITINHKTYFSSLLVMPHMEPVMWSVKTFQDLTHKALSDLKRYQPDIVILGTGKQTQLLPYELIFTLLQEGIIIECMNNRAACGTYNLLMAEDRNVLLALMMEEIK